MKYVFIFILLVHGLIHLVGLTKAHLAAEQAGVEPARNIRGIRGIYTAGWIVSCLLFIITAAALLLGAKWWLTVLVAGVILSQLLIALHWKEARAGTIVNAVIIMVIITALAARNFYSMAEKDVQSMLTNSGNVNMQIAGEQMLSKLPAPAQRYLRYAGVTGKPIAQSVKVKQSGSFLMKAGQRPVHFEAEQYYVLSSASFVWLAQMFIAGVPMIEVHDHYMAGEGAMHAKAAGLITVVDARGPEMDQGAQVRLLSEMVWFPSAFLRSNISFTSVNDSAFKVNMLDHGRSVAVTMMVDQEGRLQRLTAERYYAHDEGFSMEQWEVLVHSYGVRNGCNVPVQCSVAWKLKQGVLRYADIDVGEISVNTFTPH